MVSHPQSHADDLEHGLDVRPQISREGEVVDIPRRRIGQESVAPATAYQIICDQLMLDANSRLNVATFGTTWMEPEAEALMAVGAAKNMVDKDQYPQTTEIENRCLDIIADFWHAPSPDEPIGCSTVGSSEACMLGGMALKWRWRDRRRAANRPTDAPNLVMGANVQVCWLKFCRYWDVEPRTVPIRKGETTVHPEDVRAVCDDNTIGVVAMLGSTYDGAYEDIAGINDQLDALETETGLHVPIHVDAASGGLFTPFVDPDLVWDFRLSRVVSINASGHKYGLVYPGVGWILWRDEQARSEDLVFTVNYLGGEMPTMSLNFTKPGSGVIAQYYQFLRLGQEGFERVQQHSRDVARFLAERIEQMPEFDLVSAAEGLPVVAFCLRGGNTKSGRPRKGSLADKQPFDVYDIADAMRSTGWQLPAYSFCADREDLDIIRVVVRNAFSRDLALLFLEDLRQAVDTCSRRGRSHRQAFHH